MSSETLGMRPRRMSSAQTTAIGSRFTVATARISSSCVVTPNELEKEALLDVGMQEGVS